MENGVKYWKNDLTFYQFGNVHSYYEERQLKDKRGCDMDAELSTSKCLLILNYVARRLLPSNAVFGEQSGSPLAY